MRCTAIGDFKVIGQVPPRYVGDEEDEDAAAEKRDPRQRERHLAVTVEQKAHQV